MIAGTLIECNDINCTRFMKHSYVCKGQSFTTNIQYQFTHKIYFLVMDPVLCQFGWTMLDVQVHLLVVLLIVRVVHHLSIMTVIIVRMSLWNVVNNYKYR